MADHPRFQPAPARPNVPRIGVGLLGYGFMGRAHSNGYRTTSYMFWPPVVEPELVAICGRHEARVAEAAARYGFAGYYTDWHDLIADDRIQLLDNSGPHELHAEPCIAAARAGKHVFCEKPLAMNAADAKQMWDAAELAGVKHACSFTYRFVPAIRLARDIIQQGLLGRVYHFRVRYLQESAHVPNVPWLRGSQPAGALLLIGSHALDAARFLVGEISAVQGQVSIFNRQRPHPTEPGQTAEIIADEAVQAQLTFANGAAGSMEASFVATGRKNELTWEINGERGSIWFDLEDLNRLHVYLDGASPQDLTGFRDVLVTESHHPHLQAWWPRGHILGWEHAHINQIAHLLRAIATDQAIGPDGATFEDGYRVAVLSEAIVESSRTGRRVELRSTDAK
jgi:predicted dehydrogenase